MPKEKKEEGSPMYMALFTTLMILLLAFFILLCTMTTQQEAGFNNGIGKVQDAFGSMGGLGFLPFNLLAYSSSAPTPKSLEDKNGELGIHKDLLKGLGGAGNTEVNPEELPLPTYVRVSLPFMFDPGSAAVTPEMAEYLNITGTGLAVFDVQFTVRSYAREEETPADGDLALRRALAVTRYLHRAAGIPHEQMSAVGYRDDRYCTGLGDSGRHDERRQQTYIYVLK